MPHLRDVPLNLFFFFFLIEGFEAGVLSSVISTCVHALIDFRPTEPPERGVDYFRMCFTAFFSMEKILVAWPLRPFFMVSRGEEEGTFIFTM